MPAETIPPVDTAQPNVPATPGLSQEQEQTAIELKGRLDERAIALDAVGNRRKEYGIPSSRPKERGGHNPSALGLLSHDIAYGIKKLQIVKPARDANKHFQNNETAYREQAVKDAAQDGVEVNVKSE